MHDPIKYGQPALYVSVMLKVSQCDAVKLGSVTV